jgi:CBS domain-containing protein
MTYYIEHARVVTTKGVIDMETPVSKLLKVKGSDVVSTLPSTSIFDAVKIMEDNRIGSLPVIDSNGKLVGMLTERDCLRRVLLKELPLRSITVALRSSRSSPQRSWKTA